MIRSRSVRASDGTAWWIRRRWAPKPRWRGPFGRHLFDGFDLPFGIDLEGIGVVIAIALFVVFMIFLGGPLLVFLVETLLIIPVVLVTGILGRVLFRRPWTIEATDHRRRVEWKVVGWNASSRAADRMEKAIAATGGVPDAPPDDTPRAHRRAAR